MLSTSIAVLAGMTFFYVQKSQAKPVLAKKKKKGASLVISYDNAQALSGDAMEMID